MKNLALTKYLLNRDEETKNKQTSKAVETRRKNHSYIFKKDHIEKMRQNAVRLKYGERLGKSNIGRVQTKKEKHKRSDSQKKHIKENFKKLQKI